MPLERRLLGGIFDYENKKEKLEEVEAELEQPDVWTDPLKAQNLGKNRTQLLEIIETIDSLESGVDDIFELLALLEDGDDELQSEIFQEVEVLLKKSEKLAIVGESKMSEFARTFHEFFVGGFLTHLKFF